MQFKYFTILFLFLFGQGIQTHGSEYHVTWHDDTGYISQIPSNSLELHTNKFPTVYERQGIPNINERIPAYSPIPKGPCPLSLLEINNLPRELQNHPEVIAQKKRLLTASAPKELNAKVST